MTIPRTDDVATRVSLAGGDAVDEIVVCGLATPYTPHCWSSRFSVLALYPASPRRAVKLTIKRERQPNTKSATRWISSRITRYRQTCRDRVRDLPIWQGPKVARDRYSGLAYRSQGLGRASSYRPVASRATPRPASARHGFSNR